MSSWKKLVGKKLIWAGIDPDTEKTYLLFESKEAVAFDEGFLLEDATSTMQIILSENLSLAENVVELKKIMEENHGASEPGVSEEAVPAASGEGSTGGEDSVG